MISPVCAMCDNELTEPGGILIGPPTTPSSAITTVVKMHLCTGCTRALQSVIAGQSVIVASAPPGFPIVRQP